MVWNCGADNLLDLNVCLSQILFCLKTINWRKVKTQKKQWQCQRREFLPRLATSAWSAASEPGRRTSTVSCKTISSGSTFRIESRQPYPPADLSCAPTKAAQSRGRTGRHSCDTTQANTGSWRPISRKSWPVEYSITRRTTYIGATHQSYNRIGYRKSGSDLGREGRDLQQRLRSVRRCQVRAEEPKEIWLWQQCCPVGLQFINFDRLIMIIIQSLVLIRFWPPLQS